MAKVDVVVIGAGGAGLSAAALLAKEGKKVTVVEAGKHLGGRGMAVPDEGFKLNLGGHLLEDSGSGITKVFEYVGKKLEHGNVSSDMPVWDHEKSRWGSIRDRYSGDKSELKKVIGALADTPVRGARRLGRQAAARVDAPAHERPGRDRPVGVHLGARVHDRRLVRPLGLGQPLRAARCTTPRRAWPATRSGPGRAGTGCSTTCATPSIENGGEVLMGTPVETVLIENGDGQGRDARPRQDPAQRVPRGRGARGRLPSSPRCRSGTCCAWCPSPSCRTGTRRRSGSSPRTTCGSPGSASTWRRKEPVHAIDPREISHLAARADEPPLGLLLQPVGDGSAHRAGGRQPLRVAGGIIPGSKARDAGYLQRMFELFEDDLKDDVPGARARPTGAAATSSTTRRSA